MAMENKRIIQLNTERTTLTDGDYVMVDDAANGTAKYRLDRLAETDTTLSVSGKPADAKKTGDEITALKEDLTDIGIEQNIGYLSSAHEGYRLSNNQPAANASSSYTDYIEIPTNAVSITVRSKILANNNVEYTISPNVYVYDEDYNVLKSYGVSAIQDFRTYSLQIDRAKYIRVVQPSKAVSTTKYIKFNAHDTVAAFKHGNLNQKIKVNPFTGASSHELGTFITNRSTYEVLSNGDLKVTATQSTSKSFGIYFAIDSTSVGENDGHHIYVKVSGIDTSNVTNFNNWKVYFTSGSTQTNNAEFNQKSRTDTEVEAIVVLNGNAGRFNFLAYSDNTTATNMYFTLSNIQIIDLTEMFGAGYEPDLALFKSIYTDEKYDFTIPDVINNYSDTKILINTAVSANIYEVGADKEHTSLTELLLSLKDDTSEKTIYIDGGVYDIAQEYANAGVPVIPDDGDYNNNYTPYNVWIPENTHVIGGGNVVLKYAPDSSSVSAAESKTVSPLNIHKSCVVENITVECKNGRYCVHLDGQGASEYSDSNIKLKNVHFLRRVNDSGLGWVELVGIGLDKRQTIEFDGCIFETDNTSGANFYAHNRNAVGGVDLVEAESSRLLLSNCIFIGQGDTSNLIKLQSRTTTNLLNIPVKMMNCHIGGTIHLAAYASGVQNCYNVTLLNCGNPTITIDDANNPYPVAQY